MITARINEVYVNGNIKIGDERTLGDGVGWCGEVRMKEDNKPVAFLILKTEEIMRKEDDDSKLCKCENYDGIILTSKHAYELGLEFRISFGSNKLGSS